MGRPRTSRAVGRPPAGWRGEKVANYPQLSAHLQPETLRTLAAISRAQRRAMWRILADAITMYDEKRDH